MLGFFPSNLIHTRVVYVSLRYMYMAVQPFSESLSNHTILNYTIHDTGGCYWRYRLSALWANVCKISAELRRYTGVFSPAGYDKRTRGLNPEVGDGRRGPMR